ncbi:MAG TPA: hypothetical protein VL096_16320 [Pirellulaceae bacterium]|nr:hypothetical protein [Pirellulaceae bacterium]
MSLVHREGHSATVDILLFVDGVCFDVAQVGDRSLVLTTAQPVPPLKNARLVVTVDGEEFSYDICLYQVDGVDVSFF